MPPDPNQHDYSHLTEPRVAILLGRGTEDLARRLGEVFSIETIRAVVQELLAAARIRTHGRFKIMR